MVNIVCVQIIDENFGKDWGYNCRKKLAKKVIQGTKFKRSVQHNELRANDCYFIGGFVQSNLSKPCAIPKLPLRVIMQSLVLNSPWTALVQNPL